MSLPIESTGSLASIEATPSAQKTTCSKTESIASALFEGLLKSKIARAILITGAVVGIVLLLTSNPAGWVATALSISMLAAGGLLVAVGVVGFGLTLLIQEFFFDGHLSFEISTFARLMRNKNFNQIAFPEWKADPNIGELFLGALPNRLNFSEGEKLLKGKGTILSINEPWERSPVAFSLPYSSEDWKALDINYCPIDAKDHALLTPETMDIAADLIHKNLQDRKNVYVHCRAGIGRSATAIAAYLIKYGKDKDGKPLTIETICAGIKKSREAAIIWKKIQALKDYDKYLLN